MQNIVIFATINMTLIFISLKSVVLLFQLSLKYFAVLVLRFSQVCAPLRMRTSSPQPIGMNVFCINFLCTLLYIYFVVINKWCNFSRCKEHSTPGGRQRTCVGISVIWCSKKTGKETVESL